MKYFFRARPLLATAMVAALLVLAGCWGSKFTLLAPEKATVERKYIGEWSALNANGDPAAITIRNIDDKMYYVETRDASNTTRYVGFTTGDAIKGATFAHLRPLMDDGEIPDQWIVMRVELAEEGKKLSIRQISDEFMKGKTIESAEQLRQVIEQNIANESMYDKSETINATRVTK
jgi:hypothetical protein